MSHVAAVCPPDTRALNVLRANNYATSRNHAAKGHPGKSSHPQTGSLTHSVNPTRAVVLRMIDPSDRALLLSELRRECSPDHPLQGQRLLPLARRAGHDDVLLQELRADGLLWLVRLTWKPASDPNQPSARSFSSLQSFVESLEP